MQLTGFQEDALTEAVNIGIGRAASCLSEMVDATVLLGVPSVRLCTFADAHKHVSVHGSGPITSITQEFNGNLAGSAAVVLAQDDAITLAQLLHGTAPAATSLDICQQGILEEVGNIILNSVLGSLANLIKAKLSYGVPSFRNDGVGLQSLSRSDSDENSDRNVLMADTRFNVRERSIEGALLIVFDVGSVKTLIHALDTVAI